MSMRSLLVVFGATAMLLIGLGSAAQAQNYPWCAQYGWRDGPRNCGFVSWQQCMATVSGIGGYCERNAMYVPNQGSRPRKSRRSHR